MDPVVKPRDDRGEIDPRSLRLLAMTEWYILLLPEELVVLDINYP